MHDRDPALKTLLVLGHTLEYHSHGAQWVTREVDQQRGLHAVGCAFFAGGNIYRPTRSLQDFVREQFRAESGDPGRLDTAFAALAELSKNVECAAALPRSAAADAADASPAEAGSAGAWTPGEAPRAGAVLVAPVAQVAPSFGRSLLLLLRHSGAGSLGVVLNKPSPLALVHAARLLGRDEEMGLPRQAGAHPLARHLIHLGGPVPTPLFALHPHAELSRRLRPASSLLLGRTPLAEACRGLPASAPLSASEVDAPFLEAAAAMIEAGEAAAADFKLMMGCSTWERDQLDGEWRQNWWHAAAMAGEGGGGDGRAEGLVEVALRQPEEVEEEGEAEEAAGRHAAVMGELAAASAAHLAAVRESEALEEEEVLHGVIDDEERWQEKMRAAQNRVDSVLREVQLSVDLRRVDAREATLAAAGTLAGAPPGEASAEQAAWAGEVSQALEALDREERQSLLHELLDAEMVPASGRGQWAALLRALGGEYAAIAALAPALPTQRRIEEAAQEEEKRRYLAEAEAEEEDE